MVSGLPVYRGHGVTQPGIKIRFMVDPNVRFATEASLHSKVMHPRDFVRTVP